MSPLNYKEFIADYLEKVSDNYDIYRVTRPVTMTVGDWRQTAEIGFDTDLTTGYREGRHTRAAVLHDKGYRTGRMYFKTRRSGWLYKDVSRFRVDWFFYRCARKDGTNIFEALAMFRIVRRLGMFTKSWRKNRKEEK